jgi:hypothetical protein
MYICNCGKRHELTDDHYKLIEEGREIHLRCIDCDWQIIVGAEYDEEYEGYNMYSYAVEKDEDTIGKITSISIGK